MPQPTQNQVHVDALLTNISTAYIQSRTNFIADVVFPAVNVDKRSNKYATYTKADWFRDEAKKREAGAESAGGGYNLSSDSYFCDIYAFHKDVDDRTRDNADPGIDMNRDATEFVTQRLLLQREIQWASEFFVDAIWGTSYTPGNLWSSYTTSDPVGDVETGKTTILKNTGMEANTFALGYEVWTKLRHHPDVVDHFKYTSAQSITQDMVAALLECGRIVIAKAIKNTGAEGGTAAYDFTHGKHALLCHVAPTPGLLTPSAGYTFQWSGTGLQAPVVIKNFRMEHLEADRIEGEAAYDFKLVATDLGYFFHSVVS
ncbi:MAG: major capsid protein [Phycisphaerales bacterium]|jgi:hypothetical protein